MPGKKKKPTSRAKPGKKSPKHRAPVKKQKRDRYGRFVSDRRAPVRGRSVGKRKSAPRKTRKTQRRQASIFPVTDFEFVDESEAGDFEQYFGDEDGLEIEEDEEDSEEDDLDDDIDDDDNDDFDEDDFDYIESLEAELDSEDTPLILGEWKEELADVDLEELENVPPDDISEAVWEEILGEDFGFDDMLDYYDEGDVYEFECAISYPTDEAA